MGNFEWSTLYVWLSCLFIILDITGHSELSCGKVSLLMMVVLLTGGSSFILITFGAGLFQQGNLWSIPCRSSWNVCIHSNILPKEIGLIQLVSNETFITQNQHQLNFKVGRYQTTKGDGKVHWRVIYESQALPDSYGNIMFEVGELEKSIKVPLNDSILEKPTRIELFNPTKKYRLGSTEMANISLVCKFFICVI